LKQLAGLSVVTSLDKPYFPKVGSPQPDKFTMSPSPLDLL